MQGIPSFHACLFVTISQRTRLVYTIQERKIFVDSRQNINDLSSAKCYTSKKISNETAHPREPKYAQLVINKYTK